MTCDSKDALTLSESVPSPEEAAFTAIIEELAQLFAGDSLPSEIQDGLLEGLSAEVREQIAERIGELKLSRL